MKKIKLAIVSTHPIQYYAPVFRELARSESVHPRVFYTWSQKSERETLDREFGMRFAWDIPLLEGYESQFVENIARNPGANSFFHINTPSLSRLIRAWGADAVLVYGWNSYSHLRALMTLRSRMPVLFRGDSTLLDPITPLRKLARRLFLRWVYSHVDVAIAVGQNSRDYFLWCGLPSGKIAFAPHSIDTIRFGDPDGVHAERAAAKRRALGIPDDSIVLEFAGKFTANKNPILLLEATKCLGQSVHLILAGSGELEQRLRSAAHQQANIHFLPFQNQSDMPYVYRLADLFVLPSRSETWGLAMNEAMASGRPVLAASRVGGARDLIRAGETGWIFDSGNLDAMIAALRAANAIGRQRLLQIGENARRSIAKWSTQEAAMGIADAVSRAVMSAA